MLAHGDGCGASVALALFDPDAGHSDGVTALGPDEILMFCRGHFRETHWGTTMVDTCHGVLRDVVLGRSAAGATYWLRVRPSRWPQRVRWRVVDLSGPYRSAFGATLPHAQQVADPFHVIRLANSAIDDMRRKVQNETTVGRGTQRAPLYRTRRLLLAAGELAGEVCDAWYAKETLRGVCRISDATQRPRRSTSSAATYSPKRSARS